MPGLHPPVNARIVAYGRAVVLACAAVLSFSALFDLAVLCGFWPWQAALFPIMVDAGVAVSLASWRTSGFARRLTVALLATTVIGNAVAHILDAYRLQPHWMVIVLVGGLAPAVLAATWRLDGPVVQEPVQDGVQELEPEPVQAELEVVQEPVPDTPDAGELDVLEKARQMALDGTGRTVMLRELGPLGLTEYQAKQILRDVKAVA